MHTKAHRKIFLVIVTVILAVTVFASSMVDVKAQSSETLPHDIKVLLSDYSQYLETGETFRKTNYSSQMNLLVADRYEYYKEFYEKGLHANLVSLKSEFLMDQSVSIAQIR